MPKITSNLALLPKIALRISPVTFLLFLSVSLSIGTYNNFDNLFTDQI